jgi:hypothetical protein
MGAGGGLWQALQTHRAYLTHLALSKQQQEIYFLIANGTTFFLES